MSDTFLKVKLLPKHSKHGGRLGSIDMYMFMPESNQPGVQVAGGLEIRKELNPSLLEGSMILTELVGKIYHTRFFPVTFLDGLSDPSRG